LAAVFQHIQLRVFFEGNLQLDEIKPNQIWTVGLSNVRVTDAFGVRILVRRENADALPEKV
jgi:hypothetical protein